jgi:hypothetical protein
MSRRRSTSSASIVHLLLETLWTSAEHSSAGDTGGTGIAFAWPSMA